MIELAHFIQFFSFSLGLLAIYIGYQLLKTRNSNALRKLFFFILGVNFIVFIHVLEAFFKIVFDAGVYDSTLRPVFTWSMYPLAFVRLYMAALFISFVRDFTGKKDSANPIYISFGIFVAFISLMIYFYITPKDMSLQGEISFWVIHLILAISLLAGAFLLLLHTKDKENNKVIRLFAYFIILYAIGYIFSRSLNSWLFTASEHTQMVSLGAMALSFNVFNIFILKRFFIHKENLLQSLKSEEALNHLFNEYGITNREQEIIKLICEGKTNKEIGEILFISPVTVRDHNSNIFRKTDVKNRTQLAGLFQIYYQ